MKVTIHYSLPCGGFDGYRTVKLPKYLETASDKKRFDWAQAWINTHIKDHRYEVDSIEVMS